MSPQKTPWPYGLSTSRQHPTWPAIGIVLIVAVTILDSGSASDQKLSSEIPEQKGEIVPLSTGDSGNRTISLAAEIARFNKEFGTLASMKGVSLKPVSELEVIRALEFYRLATVKYLQDPFDDILDQIVSTRRLPRLCYLYGSARVDRDRGGVLSIVICLYIHKQALSQEAVVTDGKPADDEFATVCIRCIYGRED